VKSECDTARLAFMAEFEAGHPGFLADIAPATIDARYRE
jgi:hypothetical protein